jgi:hypothetical protein
LRKDKLNKKITNWFTKIWNGMLEDAKESEDFFVVFGYATIVCYLGFYIFNVIIASPTGYENLTLRLTITALGLGLILKDYWPESAKQFMPMYWYLTLVYSLPFFFFFMLFHNPESNIWQINGLVGIVSLTFFVNWIAYIILVSSGILLAYLAFYFTTDNPILSSNLIAIFGSYSAPIYYLLLCSNKKRKLYQNKILIEERENNIKLTKKSKELEKALAIKTDFLSNISHEVRTPINGVVTLSELLLENWYEYSESERYKGIKIVAQSGKRLLMVMNSILDLSKFTSGRMNMKMVESSLEESLREMIIECESLYLNQYKDIVIETNIQMGLDSTVIMDPERIAQVLRNLMGNAFKFTKAGKIKISLRTQGKNLEVVIEDEGIGIPEEELEEIFNPFVQSSKTKNYADGTGLGLSICKEIITAHNGKIWAENKIIGSSFHFILPRVKLTQLTQEANYQPIKAATDLVNNSPDSLKGVALMIDDDDLCHNIIRMILKNDGYEMISSYSGAEGLEFLSEHSDEIDFIFLDLMMPNMHGLDVLKKIKSDKSLAGIPVIIQSASDNKSDYSKAIELGAIGFFAKPYDRKNIIQFVDKLHEKDSI